MAPLRWGIAGCGLISADFVSAIQGFPETEHKVVACAARSTERAETFAKDKEIQKFYGSYEAMAADSDIDVVYVGTIHSTHCELSCLYMNAGKHVVCEKPLGLNCKQAESCLEASKQNNVFFMEGFWTRFFPVYDRLREELMKGTIGKVRHLSTSFGILDFLKVERIADKSIGGGVLMDVGCYSLQFAIHVYGEMPEKIHVVGEFDENGIDLFESITLIFSGQRTAHLMAHGLVECPNNAVVCGTKGRIEIPRTMWCPTEIIINGEKEEYPVPEGKRPFGYLNSGGFHYEIKAVGSAIKRGLLEHPLMPHGDTLKSAKVMDELKRQLGIKYACDE